ncbi:ADP-ribosyl cyclase/cyclic ADP-ribose hydrolase [Psidium guajava]|nr:ADP-ribosyl cyclase/cyclic ADP-ribose hydrolase [Psidium guajava]
MIVIRDQSFQSFLALPRRTESHVVVPFVVSSSARAARHRLFFLSCDPNLRPALHQLTRQP